MSKDDYIKTEAEVVTVLPGTTFKLKLPNNTEVMGTLSGKMRMHYIKLVPGDIVQCEMSKYDLTKARITYRGKKK